MGRPRRRRHWRRRCKGDGSGRVAGGSGETSAPIPADRGSTACGISSSPRGWRFLYDAEPPPHGPSEDSPTECVPDPPSAKRSRAGGGAGAVPRVSSYDDEFLSRVGGQSTQGFLSPVLQNQRDGFAKIRQAFFTSLALAVGARQLRAISDIPRTVLLDDRREFVAHFLILTLVPGGHRSAGEKLHALDTPRESLSGCGVVATIRFMVEGFHDQPHTLGLTQHQPVP